MNHLIDHLKDINFNLNDFIVVCIGTQRAYLDSVGPLVGTRLQELYPNAVIIGQLNDNCHALSLETKLKFIKRHYSDKKILAIDACCTKNKNKLGTIEFQQGSIFPGAGVGKNLPSIGDYCIKAFTVDKERQFLLEDGILADYYDNHMFYKIVRESVNDIVNSINQAISNHK